MGKKYIYLICFGVCTYKKIFEIAERTKLDYFRKLCYTQRPHTLFKALGLKRHPVQDAE